MKTMLLPAVVFSFLTLFACNKERCDNMTVVRDCTGTYLRVDQKDYHVCNTEKLASFSDGAQVKASFKKVKDCPAREKEIVCMMYHANEGWIEVKKIE